MSGVGTALLGAQGLLTLAMAGAGGGKVAGAQSQVEEFDRFGYPQWFRLATGGIELLAGVVLLAGLFVSPALAFAGAVLVTVTMLGAILTHVRVGDSAADVTPPAILLALALAVGWNHAGALA